MLRQAARSAAVIFKCAGKTAAVISHRVGLCKLADKISLMKDGALAEIDSHDELIASGGKYAKLFTAQEKWYK